jgi:hypothetical protein
MFPLLRIILFNPSVLRTPPLYFAVAKHPELAVTAVGFVLTAASKLYNVYQKSDLKQKVDHWAEDVYNGIWARVRVNESDKTVSIKGINYDKLLIRLKEMFKEKRVADNFEF